MWIDTSFASSTKLFKMLEKYEEPLLKIENVICELYTGLDLFNDTLLRQL